MAAKPKKKAAPKKAAKKAAPKKAAVKKTAVKKAAPKKAAKKAAPKKAVKKAPYKSTAIGAVVTLKQISADLANKHDVAKKTAEAMLTDLVAETSRHVKRGAKVRIPGLGILMVKKTKARMGRNPATGEQIKIPAKKKVAFRVAKDLKQAVL